MAVNARVPLAQGVRKHCKRVIFIFLLLLSIQLLELVTFRRDVRYPSVQSRVFGFIIWASDPITGAWWYRRFVIFYFLKG